MRFSLDVLRARKGDCLMLHYGTAADPRVILIDGGPRQVYGPFLKPRLARVKAVRGIDKKKPLPIDLLMVSHVDDDHIQGILDLTKELRGATTPEVKIRRLWHNSFENIIDANTDELTANFKGRFGAASLGSELPEEITLDSHEGEDDEEVVVWNLKALASIAQGAQLRKDADALQVDLNPEFANNGLIMASAGAQTVPLGELTFTIVGPMQEELADLHKKHVAWLKKLEKQGKSPDEVLAAYVDKSVANLSSVVVLVESGTGADKKRILLTGDARGDKILEGLELVGLVKDGEVLEIDILKVPHHGSDNNLDHDFFQRVIAKHYVFSGNGEHGNPERESLQMLLDARKDEPYTVHLTYPIDEIDVAREANWNKERAKDQKKHAKNPAKPVRPEWSKEKHSLTGFLEKHPGFAKKLRIVDAKEPHLIDLMDAVKL